MTSAGSLTTQGQCSELKPREFVRRPNNASRVLELIDDLDLDMEEALIADFQCCIAGIDAVIHDVQVSFPGRPGPHDEFPTARAMRSISSTYIEPNAARL